MLNFSLASVFVYQVFLMMMNKKQVSRGNISRRPFEADDGDDSRESKEFKKNKEGKEKCTQNRQERGAAAGIGIQGQKRTERKNREKEREGERRRETGSICSHLCDT